jgi:hypothetical protein
MPHLGVTPRTVWHPIRHWTARLYDNLWLAGAPAAEGEAVWPDIAPAPGIRRRRC